MPKDLFFVCRQFTLINVGRIFKGSILNVTEIFVNLTCINEACYWILDQFPYFIRFMQQLIMLRYSSAVTDKFAHGIIGVKLILKLNTHFATVV